MHLADSVKEQGRLCDCPDCPEQGAYPAPKSRVRLRDYYWFCLDHVRAYNKEWDYYAGMSVAEIERNIRLDTVWQSPTWPLGSWQAKHAVDEQMIHRFRYGDDAQAPKDRTHKAPRYTPQHTEEIQALAALDLATPVTFSTIKSRYRELARQYHPDTNNGDKTAEEKFKTLNKAYVLLKELYVER